jgi:threonine/homoserine/homoserine lactone efflux protein
MIYSSSLFLAFLMFAFVGSITPGPNNTMLLISGVNFGFRRTIPHMLGVTVGFAILVIVSGMGLGALFVEWPVLETMLRYGCALYLLYLAWQILRSGQVNAQGDAKKPISFWRAVIFQWANPKAWVMAIVGVTTYVPVDHFLVNISVLIACYIIFVFSSGSVWTLFGNWIQRFLHRPHYLRRFNLVMAILLVLSLFPLLQKSL